MKDMSSQFCVAPKPPVHASFVPAYLMAGVSMVKREVVVDGFLRSGRKRKRRMKEKRKAVKGENQVCAVQMAWLSV